MRAIESGRTFRNIAARLFLVGVGAQKAGTTWLWDYLGRHPEVAMSPIKELHYFDQRFRPDLCGIWAKEFDNQTSSAINLLAGGKTGSLSNLQYLIDRVRMNFEPAAYLEYFDRLATHGRPVIGEITPSYSLLPKEGLAEMRTMIANAGAEPRIVFVMRDPAERFWSQCRFEAPASIEQSADRIYERALDDPQFLERTRYDVTIANLRTVFKPDELLLLFYEDLFENATIEQLCRFLRIAFMRPNTMTRVHASLTGALGEARRRRLQQIFAPVYDFIDKEFGRGAPAAWRA